VIPVAQQISAPSNVQELKSLMERRDEIATQLRSLGETRAQLAQQISDIGGDAALRAAPVARLKDIDADISRLESSLRKATELIESAKARGLANEEYVPSPPTLPMNMPPTPDYNINVSTDPPWLRAGQSLATTLPITAGTVILLGVLLYWRISRSMRNQLNRILASQSGRLEELQRSIDTVAVEVERVSENQRFVTKLVGDKPATSRVPGP
jgi:hypothetical protein